MRTLAIDYGTKRIGLALSDEGGTLATPHQVLEVNSPRQAIDEILQLILLEDVEQIVVGLPLTPSGRHGSQAEETDAFVVELRAATDLPVDTYDERFTTRLAARRAGAGGDAPEDAVAAAYLLTDYLTWTSGRA